MCETWQLQFAGMRYITIHIISHSHQRKPVFSRAVNNNDYDEVYVTAKKPAYSLFPSTASKIYTTVETGILKERAIPHQFVCAINIMNNFACSISL